MLKATTTVTPKDIFDDRKLGPVRLQNHYRYSSPLNINEDDFEFEFSLYQVDPSVSAMIIETIRVLDGTQVLAEQDINQEVTDTGVTVNVNVPALSQPEEERAISLGIWYKYTQDGTDKQGNYKYSVGKLTLISPG